MSERVYCSELAQAADTQLAGTAIHVEMWLLIEYARPWKPKALLDNDLEQEVSEHLNALVTEAESLGVKLRLQFIKQGSSTDQAAPRLFLADGRLEEGRRSTANPVRLLAGSLKQFKVLLSLNAAQIIRFELPEIVAPQASDDSLLLVCTNGQRDLCCAKFGLPLFEALRIEYGSRVWQTTHIGGHRYAPNLLCLPSGIVYGFVDPAIGVDLVAGHDIGQIQFDKIRGRSCYPPLLQAAEYFLWQQVESLTVVGLWVEDEQEGRIGFTIALGGGARSGKAQIEKVALPLAVASCGAESKPDAAYELRELNIEGEIDGGTTR
jgi:hypothetical protein